MCFEVKWSNSVSGNNMREMVQWLRHKGMEQGCVGSSEFSLAVGNHGKSIFQGQ